MIGYCLRAPRGPQVGKKAMGRSGVVFSDGDGFRNSVVSAGGAVSGA